MTVLLAFHHAVVAGEVAPVAERPVLFRMQGLNRAGEPQNDGPGLPVDAASGRPDPHIDLPENPRGPQRRFDGQPVTLDGKVLLERAVVDRDLARSLADANAGDGGLPPPRAHCCAVRLDLAANRVRHARFWRRRLRPDVEAGGFRGRGADVCGVFGWRWSGLF